MSNKPKTNNGADAPHYTTFLSDQPPAYSPAQALMAGHGLPEPDEKLGSAGAIEDDFHHLPELLAPLKVLIYEKLVEMALHNTTRDVNARKDRPVRAQAFYSYDPFDAPIYIRARKNGTKVEIPMHLVWLEEPFFWSTVTPLVESMVDGVPVDICGIELRRNWTRAILVGFDPLCDTCKVPEACVFGVAAEYVNEPYSLYTHVGQADNLTSLSDMLTMMGYDYLGNNGGEPPKWYHDLYHSVMERVDGEGRSLTSNEN